MDRFRLATRVFAASSSGRAAQPRMATLLLLSLLAVGSHTPVTVAQGIVVNGVQLSQAQLDSYQFTIPVGHYWYDRMSGLWGLEGGPGIGQIEAMLDLGGPMSPNASRSETGVYFNGREIHSDEVLQLMQYFQQQIPLGRYWLRADGVGGIEGQEASFVLTPPEQQQPTGSGQVFEDEMADFCARHGGCP